MKYIDIKNIKKGTANTVLGLNDADEAVLSEINIDLSNYVTENELNEAIDKLEIQNIPYVVFGTPSSGNTPTILAGSVEDVFYASRRKEPHFAYLYNGSINDYGSSGELIELTISGGLIGRQFEACKYNAVNSEIVKIIVFISPDLANGGYIYTISNYRYKTATHSWVEANYQQKGNYLTSVPSEYVTESELELKGYVNTEDLDRALAEKQDVLISGENIATINGNSLLDGGDLIIQGGSGAANIVSLTQAEYDELVNSGAVDMQTLYLITDATVDANFKTINGSYILGDGNIDTNQIITLTQAEYDALGVYEDNIFYVITDPVLPEYVAPDDMYEYVDTVLGNINNQLETIIG